MLSRISSTGFFKFSWYTQYDGQLVYNFCGRSFVLPELKKALIAASGGYATGIYLTWQDYQLDDLIDTIELVAMVQARSSVSTEGPGD